MGTSCLSRYLQPTRCRDRRSRRQGTQRGPRHLRDRPVRCALPPHVGQPVIVLSFVSIATSLPSSVPTKIQPSSTTGCERMGEPTLYSAICLPFAGSRRTTL